MEKLVTFPAGPLSNSFLRCNPDRNFRFSSLSCGAQAAFDGTISPNLDMP